MPKSASPGYITAIHQGTINAGCTIFNYFVNPHEICARTQEVVLGAFTRAGVLPGYTL